MVALTILGGKKKKQTTDAARSDLAVIGQPGDEMDAQAPNRCALARLQVLRAWGF